MFKLSVGFILGVVATFYSYPTVKDFFGVVFKSEIVETLNDKISYPTSISPAYRQQIEETSDAIHLMTIIALTKAKPISEKAHDYVLKIITDLVNKEPSIATVVQNSLKNGITNQEALAIFEKYISVQS